MNPNLHDIDLIQRYLDRSLSEEEKRNLEKRLKDEPSLQSMYREHQQLIRGIRYSHLQHKLRQLQALEAALPEINIKKEAKQVWLQSNWKQATAIAASLVLCTLAYLFWSRPADPEALYAEYFKPYPNVFEAIVRDENQILTKRAQAFYAYEAGDYTKAVTLFSELLREKKEPGILLCLGNANLSLGNTSEARNNFITLIKDFDEFDIQAKWYLGLSYIKEGDMKSAQLILQELNNTEFTYSSKAKELLKKVK